MFDLCSMEFLKSRRTFQRLFLLIGPVVFGVLLLMAANVAPDAMTDAWEQYSKMIFNMWTLTFNSLGISLLCILSEQREQQAGSYRLFYVEAESLPKIWYSKIVVIVLYCLFATFFVTLFVGTLAGINRLGWNSIISILAMGGVSWLTSLSVIPVVLFLTKHFGILSSLAIGGVGLITAPIMAAGKNWVFNPYSYSLRAIVPITRIQPNAIRITGESELLNFNAIGIAVGLTMLLLVLLSAVTAMLFSKSEVR